ncbi:hypothetical protein F5888DRAFT_1056256 [Russula emetica]|nr:hypothetical protein F5888DRAFT_1056256 [Russula emetica]
MKPNPSVASLMTFIQSLRHLCSVNVDLKFVLQLLSAARALVDRDPPLGVDTVHYEMQGASLLGIFNACLVCNLQVLTELTYFRFYVQRNEVVVHGWVGHTVLTGTPYFGHAFLFCLSHPVALQVYPRRGNLFFRSEIYDFWVISHDFLVLRPRD